MYLKQLDKLRDYNIAQETIAKLDEYLNSIAEEGTKRFSPNHMAERTGLDIQISQTILLRTAQIGTIQTYYEIECPEGDSDFFVTRIEDVDWNTECVCRVCGTEYIPNPSNIWVTFSILDPPSPKALCRL